VSLLHGGWVRPLRLPAPNFGVSIACRRNGGNAWPILFVFTLIRDSILWRTTLRAMPRALGRTIVFAGVFCPTKQVVAPQLGDAGVWPVARWAGHGGPALSNWSSVLGEASSIDTDRIAAHQGFTKSGDRHPSAGPLIATPPPTA